MKRTNKIMAVFLLSVLGLFLASAGIAQNKKAKSKKSKTETAQPAKEVKKEEPNDEKPTGLKRYGIEIEKVIKNEQGVIRGYDFGVSKSKIRETEDAQYVADGKDFIIYHVQVSEKEKAEIIYYLDANENVKGFGIAFLVNANIYTQNVEETLVDEFQNYFNDRYGKFVSNEKGDEVWTSKDGSYTVEMGDSSEDVNLLEIEIEIFKK